MKYLKLLAAVALFVIPMAASAQSETTVSRLYLVNPDPQDIKNSMDALSAALETRDIRPSRQVGMMPTELPDSPSELENRSINMGFAVFNTLGCGPAYAQFGTASGSDHGLLGSMSERIFGCMYLSKRGIRMALVIEQKSASSTGLMGSLMSGIKNGIRGNDGDYAKKAFDGMLKAVREKVPGVLIELQEFPGDVTRPDDEKVKALGFGAPVPPVASGALMQPKSQTSAAATPPAATASASGQSAIAQAIEARKQLNELGVTYHSLDQFHDAIKRKDAILVQLFMQARSVDVLEKNKKGETAVSLAKRAGDPEIIRLIGDKGTEIRS